MIQISKEKCEEIRETLMFQLGFANLAKIHNISISAEDGTLFLLMIEESMKQVTCDFCHEDKDGYTKTNGAFYLTLDMFEGWRLHAGKCKPRAVSHCPMCGRKLLTFKEEVIANATHT